MLLGVGRKHRHDAVEFCDENRTIYFRRAKLFGVDGLVPNVPLLRSSIQIKPRLHYVFVDVENSMASCAVGNRQYINDKSIFDMKMFITYKKVEIGDGHLEEGDFEIQQNKFVYRYELESWARDHRYGIESYSFPKESFNVAESEVVAMPVVRPEYFRFVGKATDEFKSDEEETLEEQEEKNEEEQLQLPEEPEEEKEEEIKEHIPTSTFSTSVKALPVIVYKPSHNADLPVVTLRPAAPEVPKGRLTDAHPPYNMVETIYEEVSVWGTKCLMTRGFENMFSRNSIPEGAYVYYLRDPDDIYDHLPKIIVNNIKDLRKSAYFGMLITYKPIKFPETKYRFVVFKRGEFAYTDNKVKPDEVDDWIYKMNAKDNNSRRVLAFIENFRKKGMLSGISEEQFSELYREHLPYHFACMLKSTFNRGEVYIALPSKKIVWRDNDNRYYNVDGQFYRSREVYAELGRTIDDAYYVDSNNINGISIGPVSKYVKKAYDMMGKYKSKFPNR